ncbi:MAG: hypothetical protein BGO26_17835 [Actinobacteria bacterium 69-20]|jgi:hypothetical protein|nr:hypothetical protein [Actinomycetota bacterium]OJV24463.1 MAG: hypothetical protein BGO26_17835 [Actinobacteria bacterium 69-20]
MTTTRGFVDRVEIGRAGMVSVRVITATGPVVFTIADLDADPERFNERLTKVALARDAMNRADPVEIESTDGAAGQEIGRIARISRDELGFPSAVQTCGGLVIRVALHARNVVEGEGDAPDEAIVSVLATTGSTMTLRLPMQIPEREVAAQQLGMIRDAQAAGQLMQFLASDTGEKQPTIVAVWAGSDASADGGGTDTGDTASGFVETLGVILPAGTDALDGSLALSRITTAPELTGDGGTVDPAPFDPAALEVFVARGSVPYALLEAALRDNLRVRVRFHAVTAQPPPGPPDRGPKPTGDPARGAARKEVTHVTVGETASSTDSTAVSTAVSTAEPLPALLTEVELLAPLASASRPVWLHIDRHLLDIGPDETDGCTDGLPTSSLKPRSLRDLRIPYTAEWKGCGCFNPGIYRFEITGPQGCAIEVDGKPLCVYDSGTAGVMIAYSCLGGDHCVKIVIPDYVCDTDFNLNVYRIR